MAGDVQQTWTMHKPRVLSQADFDGSRPTVDREGARSTQNSIEQGGLELFHTCTRVYTEHS